MRKGLDRFVFRSSWSKTLRWVKAENHSVPTVCVCTVNVFTCLLFGFCFVFSLVWHLLFSCLLSSLFSQLDSFLPSTREGSVVVGVDDCGQSFGIVVSWEGFHFSFSINHENTRIKVVNFSIRFSSHLWWCSDERKASTIQLVLIRGRNCGEYGYRYADGGTRILAAPNKNDSAIPGTTNEPRQQQKELNSGQAMLEKIPIQKATQSRNEHWFVHHSNPTTHSNIAHDNRQSLGWYKRKRLWRMELIRWIPFKMDGKSLKRTKEWIQRWINLWLNQ